MFAYYIIFISPLQLNILPCEVVLKTVIYNWLLPYNFSVFCYFFAHFMPGGKKVRFII